MGNFPNCIFLSERKVLVEKWRTTYRGVSVLFLYCVPRRLRLFSVCFSSNLSALFLAYFFHIFFSFALQLLYSSMGCSPISALGEKAGMGFSS